MLTATATPEAARFADEAAEHFANLYWRWQDESKYEDINDYKQAMQSIAERCGVTLLRMTGRPFRLTYSVGERQFELTISGSVVRYKRIK